MINKVLIVEDDAALRSSIVQTLELEDLEPIPTGSFVQARRSIRSNFSGVILSDIRMPDQDGFDVLRHAQTVDADLPVILLTGHSDVPTAIRAVREGAYDYLEKPFETSLLVNTLHRALKHRALILGHRDMSRQLERSDVAAQNFPGKGVASNGLRNALREAATSDQPVHLFGEDGSGKRTAAFVIHTLDQTDRVFETLNCQTASPQDLQQINLKHPVTLSIKNAHMASPEFRNELEKALAGALDTRLITTSLNTTPEVSDKRHAGDPITVYVPSIYERREDIHEIFGVNLRQAARATGVDVPMMAEEIQAYFLDREVPKNFFELRQMVAETFAKPEAAANVSLAEKLENYEKTIIADALKSVNGRVAEAAQILNVPRNTLYDRMSKLGIIAKDYR